MAIFTLKSYRKVIKKRMKNFEKFSEDSVAQASQFIYLLGKSDAPHKSGMLAASGKRIKMSESRYRVQFGYKGEQGFAVAPWTNQEFSITPKKPGGKASRWLKTPVGQSVRYGDNNGVRWTAKTYPWWTVTVLNGREKFRGVTITNIQNVFKIV